MKSYLVISLVVIIGSILFLKDEIKNFDIKRHGKLTTMKIVSLPKSCIGTKAKWYMKVEYEGRSFSKQIPGGFCERYHIGDTIKLIYKQGVDRVILPIEKNSNLEIYSIGGFFLIGIYIGYLGFKRKN